MHTAVYRVHVNRALVNGRSGIVIQTRLSISYLNGEIVTYSIDDLITQNNKY